jgi:SET domain-containing protein
MVAFGLDYKAAPFVKDDEKRECTWMDITAVNGEITVRKEPSKIHGFGLVAREHIAAGAYITELVGEVITTKTAKRRLTIKYKRQPTENICDVYQRYNDDAAEAEKIKTQPPKDTFMFRVDNDWVLDATVAGSLARFVNHSCEPNAEAVIIKGFGDGKHVVFFALREIKAGEEVCIDYGLVQTPGKPKMMCTCGFENCCGRIDRTTRK